MSELLPFFSKGIPGTALLVSALLLASSSYHALGGDQPTKAQATNAQGTDSHVAKAQVLIAPPMTRPAYRQPVNDPVLGTMFTRVTDPGQRMAASILCRQDYCRHRYSSAQAWNADQTLLAISKGCNGFCFLDGQTYEPAFHRAVHHDCKWHPTDPVHLICVQSTKVYAWAPRTNTRTIIYAPTGYTNIQFGPYKGNLSVTAIGWYCELPTRQARWSPLPTTSWKEESILTLN